MNQASLSFVLFCCFFLLLFMAICLHLSIAILIYFNRCVCSFYFCELENIIFYLAVGCLLLCFYPILRFSGLTRLLRVRWMIRWRVYIYVCVCGIRNTHAPLPGLVIGSADHPHCLAHFSHMCVSVCHLCCFHGMMMIVWRCNREMSDCRKKRKFSNSDHHFWSIQFSRSLTCTSFGCIDAWDEGRKRACNLQFHSTKW